MKSAIVICCAALDDPIGRRCGFDAGFDSFDFDQTPAYDLTEPIPDFDLDQSAGA